VSSPEDSAGGWRIRQSAKGNRNALKEKRLGEQQQDHWRQITLARLALVCHVFGAFPKFDEAYRDLQRDTDGSIDLEIPTHRKALLVWLNKWQMRHISRESHNAAGRLILQWHNTIGRRLPSKPLKAFGTSEIRLAAEAFSHLAPLRPQRRIFGPTAASKILFAVRPGAFPPWDNFICASLGYDGGRLSYERYMEDVQRVLTRLDEACRRHGFGINDLPQYIGRPESTAVKLIDEYNWLTITRKYEPPSFGDLASWISLTKP
jgi:hypothetical protein